MATCALGILSAEYKLHEEHLSFTNLPCCLEKDYIVLVAGDGGSVLAFEDWGFLGTSDYGFSIIKSWWGFDVVGLEPPRTIISVTTWKRIRSATLAVFGENDVASKCGSCSFLCVIVGRNGSGREDNQDSYNIVNGKKSRRSKRV
ncbi:uncharacterized protein EAF01_011265 [Botrytis porri]|uniref:Uncharacterized protein n=1 Tax=Botrytis porri TaxID=87229 RepID=A0A4Z1KZ33_9HELO|nr:uncharacterized protein EAF01_011265 [Botrytis porri]KAF7886587.1 hypothetical protein EAF01_011265 [Botrytis porri]TGO89751.1 hypothetical protein BPOR_0095g00120 [Botrytis porri]